MPLCTAGQLECAKAGPRDLGDGLLRRGAGMVEGELLALDQNGGHAIARFKDKTLQPSTTLDGLRIDLLCFGRGAVHGESSMLRSVRSAGMSALVLAGVFAASADVRAMPILSMGPAATAGLGAEKAYVVCGPFRCWRRPGWGYGWGWRRPFYGNAYGWARNRPRPGSPVGSNH